ncbi:transposase [Peptostreptococcus porci]|uniref:transposase n=1 Tax=Peptostreptococcus porci TaxID=2652282 RepID=UPI003AB988CA
MIKISHLQDHETLIYFCLIFLNKAYSYQGFDKNLSESLNARFRDLHRGVHHKCDNKYVLHYANQSAFMSDNRQKSNGDLFSDILNRCLWVANDYPRHRLFRSVNQKHRILTANLRH